MRPARSAPVRLSKELEASDMTDTVILTVELASGRFKSELWVPLFGAASPSESMGQWADFIETGFRIGATNMNATFGDRRETK